MGDWGIRGWVGEIKGDGLLGGREEKVKNKGGAWS